MASWRLSLALWRENAAGGINIRVASSVATAGVARRLAAWLSKRGISGISVMAAYNMAGNKRNSNVWHVAANNRHIGVAKSASASAWRHQAPGVISSA